MIFQKEKWKEIVYLALPVVISKLSFTMMGIVDTAMVGHLGTTEQAAAGFAVVYLFTLYVFGLGLVTSVNTLVSQLIGAKQPKLTGTVLVNGLIISLGIGVITWSVLLFSKPIFYWMGMNPGICEHGYTYLFYRGFGILAVFAYWVYNSFFEGTANTRTPMYVTIGANVVNIILDYIFIFGYGPIAPMGLKGAGLATALSNIFMFGVLFFAAHRKGSVLESFGLNNLIKKIQWKMQKRIILLGIPMGMQMFLEVGAFLIFTTIVGWTGDAELAATQIAMRIMSITFMTAWGISIAATTLVGRHQGEKRSDLAQNAIGRALILILATSILVCITMIIWKNEVISLFTPFKDVAHIAVQLILVSSVFAIFDGISLVSYGALRGAGDTVWPLWNVSIMHWCIGIPLVYCLTIPMKLGAYGNWLGMALMIAGQAVLMLHRVKSGKWKKIQLVS